MTLELVPARRSCLLVALAAGLLGGCARPLLEVPLLPLPDVRQSNGYTCGVAALQAVLAYYGVETREDRLAAELGATPRDGVSPPAIVRVARAHGVGAEIKEPLTVEDLACLVSGGRPVILALQAWSDRPHPSYAADWDDGHYVVVIAVRGDELILEDPSLLGSRGLLRRRELMERWHDTDGQRAYRQMGIVFSGRPAPPPRLQRID